MTKRKAEFWLESEGRCIVVSETIATEELQAEAQVAQPTGEVVVTKGETSSTTSTNVDVAEEVVADPHPFWNLLALAGYELW